MTYNYSAKSEANCAKAVGISLAISTKKSVEICNAIRGKPITLAKKILQNAIDMKIPIPMKIYNDNTGHKAGMAAGRYAVSACEQILLILESAEANAQTKGLSANNLVVKHASAQNGPKTWHYGRQRRREAKRTHVEFILQETKNQEKPKEKRAKPEEKQNQTKGNKK